MSTSIYESTPKETPLASPPSSRRRAAYRRDVYGEKETSPVHGHHRKHSKKKMPLMSVVLVVLLVVAGGLVITGVMMSMSGAYSSNENPILKEKESPFSLRK